MKKQTNNRTKSIAILTATAAIGLLVSCGTPTLPVATYPLSAFPEDRVTRKVVEKSFGTCSPQQVQDKIRDFKKPEMMALGGSVFNGVSSLQINWWLADWSPPMQVARALMNVPSGHIEKFTPAPYKDYGSPPYGTNKDGQTTFRLGLDLEKLHLATLPTTVRDQAGLMGRFKTYAASERKFNDNLASGGSAIEDILYGTATDYRRRLLATDPDSLEKDGSGIGKTYEQEIDDAANAKGYKAIKAATNLIKVFYAENSSFVLDPQRDDCISEMTALDQVLLRQPKRLLVGVGTNSGLFDFLIDGQDPAATCADSQFTFGNKVAIETRYVTINQTAKDEFIERMGKLIDKLADEGSDIQTIYMLGQLRPSAVANLKPTNWGRIPRDPNFPKDPDYYNEYGLDFDFDGPARLPGALVRTVDHLNSQINQMLKDRIDAKNRTGKKKPRFVYVDLEAMSDDYDYKHTGKREHQIVVTADYLPGLNEPVYLDNRVLTFSEDDQMADNKPIGQKIEQGGIFSIDNLHPTVVGYSLIANKILKTMVEAERIHIPDAAWAIVDPRAIYAHSSAADGNILRRRDRGLAHRENYLQVGFNILHTLTKTGPKCLPNDAKSK